MIKVLDSSIRNTQPLWMPAPTEVVCVLKAIAQDGEVRLGDGRLFIDPSKSKLDIMLLTAAEKARCCTIHPDFQLVALANRPGFPFLGHGKYTVELLAMGFGAHCCGLFRRV